MAIKLNPHDRGRCDGDGIGCSKASGPPGIDAPKDVAVHREEVFEHIRHEIGSTMTKIGCEDKALLAKEYENATAVFSEKG